VFFACFFSLFFEWAWVTWFYFASKWELRIQILRDDKNTVHFGVKKSNSTKMDLRGL